MDCNSKLNYAQFSSFLVFRVLLTSIHFHTFSCFFSHICHDLSTPISFFYYTLKCVCVFYLVKKKRKKNGEKSNVCVNQYLKHNHSTKHTYTNKNKTKKTDYQFYCFIFAFIMVSVGFYLLPLKLPIKFFVYFFGMLKMCVTGEKDG